LSGFSQNIEDRRFSDPLVGMSRLGLVIWRLLSEPPLPSYEDTQLARDAGVDDIARNNKHF
jgi:hypothetical protein